MAAAPGLIPPPAGNLHLRPQTHHSCRACKNKESLTVVVGGVLGVCGGRGGS